MVTLEKIAKNIEKKSDGIYYSINNSKISYPDSGNQDCMQIERDSFWFVHRNNIIIEAIKKYNDFKVFYDIGGGNGFVSEEIQNLGFDTVMVEPGIHGARNALKRKIKNVLCSTIEDAGFEDSSLDSIGMFDVVEHIENDIKFLQMTNKYLKKGGIIYITVPAFNFLWSNEDNEAGHYRRYNLKNLKKTLVDSGYKVTYSTYIFSILPLPIFIFRTIPSFFGFNKKSNDLSKQKKEHKKRKGFIDNILQKIWNWEVNQIKKSNTIRFGGSCFIVAEKVSN